MRPDHRFAARVPATRAPDYGISVGAGAPDDRVGVTRAPDDRVAVACAPDDGIPVAGTRDGAAVGRDGPETRAVRAAAAVAPDDVRRRKAERPGAAVVSQAPGDDAASRPCIAPGHARRPRVGVGGESSASKEVIAPDDLSAPRGDV